MKKGFLRLGNYLIYLFLCNRKRVGQLVFDPIMIKNQYLYIPLVILILASCSKQKEQSALIFEQKEDHYAVSGKDYAITFDSETIDIQLPTATATSSMKITTATPILEDNKVIYKDIANQADLIFYDKGSGNAGYDIRLRPRGNLEDVNIELEDAENVYLSSSGQLVIPLPEGELRHSKPYNKKHTKYNLSI